MNVIYYGPNYYMRTGSAMNGLETEDKRKTDWGKVEVACEQGDNVFIRQATPVERAEYEVKVQACIDRWKKIKSTV
jgi:hypothetical protein